MVNKLPDQPIRIGPYETLEALAEGGLGSVYKVRHTSSQSTLALKVMRKELSAQPEIVQRFLREAQVAKSLSHRNILQTYDSGEAEGYYYIAMEYFPGDILSSLVKIEPLDSYNVRQIGVQIADALAHIHSHGIIHRDVKPANIMLDSNGLAKLMDFSIAQWKNAEVQQLTDSGQIVGTIQYISPEQFNDPAKVTAQADIFSLGATLYFLLSGQPPFSGHSIHQMTQKILNDEPPLVTDHVKFVHPQLAQIVHKAMAKKPQKRFADALELKRALANIDITVVPGPVVGKTPALPAADSATDEKTPALPAADSASDEKAPAAVKVCLVCGSGYDPNFYNVCPQCSTFVSPSEFDIAPVSSRVEPTDSDDNNKKHDSWVYSRIESNDSGDHNDEYDTLAVFEALGSYLLPPPTSSSDDAEEEISTGQLLCYLTNTASGKSKDITSIDLDIREEAMQIPVHKGDLLLGRLKILDLLDEGGSAKIFRVQDVAGIARPLACKILDLGFDPDGLLSKLKHQYKNWLLLSDQHPDRVIRLENVSKVPLRGAQCIGVFMELARESLARKYHIVGFGEAAIANVTPNRTMIDEMIAMCRCVQAVHDIGMVHRDIKPANFLVTGDGGIKLADFELLVPADSKRGELSVSGTPAFMAPETFEGDFSVRSDIYALGVSLLAMLIRQIPWDNQRGQKPNVQKRRQRIENYLEKLPVYWQSLFQRCLDPKRKMRYSSVEYVICELEYIREHSDQVSGAVRHLHKILLDYSSSTDVESLIKHLDSIGYQCLSNNPRQDLLLEYCHREAPDEILLNMFRLSDLYKIAEKLEIDTENLPFDRKMAARSICRKLGFNMPQELSGPVSMQHLLRKIKTETNLYQRRDELMGAIGSAARLFEEFIDLHLSFWGYTFIGNDYKVFIGHELNARDGSKLTLGQKVAALRFLNAMKPRNDLHHKYKTIFADESIVDKAMEDLFSKIIPFRNAYSHNNIDQYGHFEMLKAVACEFMDDIESVFTLMTERESRVRSIQITNIEQDVYGRKFYRGIDEEKKNEIIYSSQSLEVAGVYTMVPVTNPVRIEPFMVAVGKQ